VRARDLFSQMRAARHRWERFISAGGIANLDAAQLKMKKISLALMPGNLVVSPDDKRKLAHYSQVVIAALSDESGKIVAGIEAEEENNGD
jgi:hypothetical protein